MMIAVMVGATAARRVTAPASAASALAGLRIEPKRRQRERGATTDGERR
jgi:hypothetical protein